MLLNLYLDILKCNSYLPDFQLNFPYFDCCVL